MPDTRPYHDCEQNTNKEHYVMTDRTQHAQKRFCPACGKKFRYVLDMSSPDKTKHIHEWREVE